MFKKVLSNFSKTKPQYLNFKFQNYSKTQKQIEKGYLTIYFFNSKRFSNFHLSQTTKKIKPRRRRKSLNFLNLKKRKNQTFN
jgi:pyruvate/2-oxoacid:ferredoxin oxidoreductase beta subunit